MTQETQVITVLLVEDHASYRQALETVMAIQGDLRVVAQVGSGDEAAAAAVEHRPQVALVDLDLPGASGVEAIDGIRRASPVTACVVLSALADDVELGRAIEAGASAVLHKSTDIRALLDVVRQVAAGAAVLPPEDTSRRLRALAAARDRGWQARVLRNSLTTRELEVLRLLTDGFDGRRIARRLGISPRTADTHISNLLAKLAVNSRLEAVAKARRLGLLT